MESVEITYVNLNTEKMKLHVRKTAIQDHWIVILIPFVMHGKLPQHVRIAVILNRQMVAHVMEMVNVNLNLAKTIYHVFKIVVVEIISVNTNLERPLTIVRKIVVYVEMETATTLKVVRPALMTVEHVLHQIHVEMGSVM